MADISNIAGTTNEENGVVYIPKFVIDNLVKEMIEVNEMDVNKAKEAAKVMNRIEKCESFLKSLKGRSYNDEFTIYYRGFETCELEEEALQLLIEHYEDELAKLNKSLNNI